MRRHASPDGFVEEMQFSDRWVRISKRRIPGGGTVAVYTDITELKHRQMELEAAKSHAESANEAKSRFLASMSHELRTPLNAIIGYSEMLIEEALDQHDELVPDLEKIAGAGRNLLALINDILDLSKIEANKMEVFLETFDVAALLRDVEATVAPLVAQNGNRLVRDARGDLGDDAFRPDEAAPEPLQPAVQRSEIHRVRNHHAEGEAQQEAGRRLADIRRQGHRHRHDGGAAGAPVQCVHPGRRLDHAQLRRHRPRPQHHPKLLRHDRRHRPRRERAGPRLDLHHGGAGGLSARTGGAGGRLPAPSPQGAKAVLIIDDDPAARRVVTQALAEAGLASVEAASGAEGIEAARAHRPAAIILDIIMPHQDGWSVLRSLKSDPELCEIPVILATILADRELGLSLGAVEYLTKPIDKEKLIRTVNAHGGGERDVLVIDDDVASRDFMRRILVKNGWSVREAGNGARGLELMRQMRPRLVLLDLLMPEMDGFQTLNEMQQSPEFQKIPVVVVTSKDLSVNELKWLRERAAAVVNKGANSRKQLVKALERQIALTGQGAGSAPAANI